MRAIVLNTYGDTSGMQMQTINKPDIRPGCVMIRVLASSVNPIDTKMRQMGETMPIASQVPAILGIDVAGEIVQVGEGVTDFNVCDLVYGCPGGLMNIPGSLAEFMVADARTIAHVPKNISILEAAALPLVSITAWEAIFERMTPMRDDTLLIYGGTGGVGHIAVQLARTTGARIIATASSNEKAELARSLGAHDVFDARTTTPKEAKQTFTYSEGFDLCFDTIGGEHLIQSFDAVKFGGDIVTIAARANVDLSFMHAKGLSLHVVFMLAPLIQNKNLNRYNYILTDITKRVERETLRPLLDTHVFPFEQAAEAHAYLESGKATGKIVISHDK